MVQSLQYEGPLSWAGSSVPRRAPIRPWELRNADRHLSAFSTVVFVSSVMGSTVRGRERQ